MQSEVWLRASLPCLVPTAHQLEPHILVCNVEKYYNSDKEARNKEDPGGSYVQVSCRAYCNRERNQRVCEADQTEMLDFARHAQRNNSDIRDQRQSSGAQFTRLSRDQDCDEHQRERDGYCELRYRCVMLENQIANEIHRRCLESFFDSIKLCPIDRARAASVGHRYFYLILELPTTLFIVLLAVLFTGTGA